MGIIKGKVFKYGDNINTDVIFPGKYTYTVTEPEEIAKHALEDLDPDFIKKVKPGDIIVAGYNFGCGSSREQAAFCLKYAKVGAVIAKSFARIYFRNCINAGLPILMSEEIVDSIENNDEIEIDFEKGSVNTEKGKFSFPPLPEEVLQILNAGGLIEYIKKGPDKE